MKKVELYNSEKVELHFFGGVWEPFLYGLNTHKQSVRRSKDTCQGDPRPEASAQTTQVTRQYLGCRTSIPHLQ